jgi:hypothetical protein
MGGMQAQAGRQSRTAASPSVSLEGLLHMLGREAEEGMMGINARRLIPVMCQCAELVTCQNRR